DSIQEVNERLRKCDDLLKRGHRAEAIELAEGEPNLLDAAGTLDFLEFPLWVDYVSQFELPSPPELIGDVAAELDEAYTAQFSMEKLLQQYRLRSLARSPLPARISILRQIAHKDPDNPLWQEDLKTFEKFRRKELTDALQIAAKNGDSATLASIERELKSTPWASPVSPKLLEKSEKLNTTAQRNDAKKKLEAIADDLHAAWSEQSPDAGRQARSRWSALLTIAELDESDPLCAEVQPALDWLAEEDDLDRVENEHREAVAALERGIDGEASRLELEKLFHAAVRNDRELSETLRYRYAERIRFLGDAARRKSRMIWSSIIVTTLLIAGGMGYVIHSQLKARELSGHLKTFAAFIEQGKLQEADRYSSDRRDLEPSIYSHPQFQKLVGDLDDAKRVEEGRQQQLEAALSAARTSGLGDPSFESIETALAELKRAETEIAKGPSEQARLKLIENDILKEKNKLQKDTNDTFQKRLLEITAGIDMLSIADESGIESALRDAASLDETPRVDETLKHDLQLVINRLNGMKETAQSLSRDALRLIAITDRVGRMDDYIAQLKRYIQNVSSESSRRSKAFEEVIAEESADWRSVMSWNNLQSNWKRLDLETVTTKDAKLQFDNGRAFAANHARFPATLEIAPVISQLKTVTTREEDGLIDEMLQNLKSRPVTDLYSLRTRSGRRYYGPDPPRENATRKIYEMKYFKHYEMRPENIKTAQVPVDDVSVLRSDDGKLTWLAPQWHFSNDIAPKFEDLKLHEWESEFGDVIGMLAADEKIDPVLRFMLIKYILRIARDGSSVLKSLSNDQMEILEETATDGQGANWADPEDRQGMAFRRQTETALKQVSGLKKLKDDSTTLLKQLNEGAWRREYVWVGWLYRSHEGQWLCGRDDKSPQVSGKLLVLDKSGQTEFKPIGDLKDGKVTLVENSPAFKEGRPVFVSRDLPLQK
nr:hypothetical protein [Planctomycetota bacterium]